MILSELPERELAERLRRDGVLIGIGPLAMRLSTPYKELLAPLACLYAHFRLLDEQTQIVDFEVRVDSPSLLRGPLLGQAATFVDGRRAFAPFPRRLALPMLEWAINWCVFTRPNQYLLLHAAVLERGGRGLLLSGRPGAGKSTLCAALIFRGWRLLSDEVAMIPPVSEQLLPVPRPVGLKNASIGIIRSFAPEAVIGPECPGTRKGTVAHLQPPGDGMGRDAEPADPAWIVFPRFEEGAAAKLHCVSRGDAMLRVAEEGFNYSLLGVQGFETLASVMDGCACFELHYGALDDAVEICDRLAAEPVPSAALGGSGDSRP